MQFLTYLSKTFDKKLKYSLGQGLPILKLSATMAKMEHRGKMHYFAFEENITDTKNI